MQSDKTDEALMSSTKRGIQVRVISAVVGIVGAILIYFLPPPAGLTADGMHGLGALFFMIIFLAFRPIPIRATALATIWIFWAILGLAPSLVFAGWTNTLLWFIFAAFMISLGMVETGLAKRIAYGIVSRFGFTPRRLLLAFVVATIVSLIILPDANARTAVLLTLAIGFLSLAGLSKDSPIAKWLGITIAYLNVGESQTFMLTASAVQLSAVGVLGTVSKIDINYPQWAMYAALPSIVMPVLAAFFIIPRLYKTHGPVSAVESSEKIKAEAAALGKLKGKEALMLVLTIGAIALWATGGYTNISVPIVGLIVAVIIFSPLIGIKFSSVPDSYWDVIFFNGTLLALPGILSKVGVSTFLAKTLGHFVTSTNPVIFALSIYVIALVASAITSNVAAIGILLPSLITVGHSLGFSPVFVTVILCFSVTVELFYYTNAPSITALGFGLYSVRDWYKFVPIVALLQFIMIPIWVLTWWHFVGLV